MLAYVANKVFATSAFILHSRNTFILKRRVSPNLHKKNQKLTKLTGHGYVYDPVDHKTFQRKSTIGVVLTSFVDGLGSKGEDVSVKLSIAYNHLLLPGLAVYNTPENNIKYSMESDAQTDEKLHTSAYAQRTVNVLEKIILAVILSKDNPWVIEKWHIKASLRKAGYYIPEKAITLPKSPIHGPDLLKQNKEFFCEVTINGLEKAQVRCRIHHWSTNPSDRLPYVLEHWKVKANPLFE